MYHNIGLFILFNLWIVFSDNGFVSGQGKQQQMLNKLVCIDHDDCGSCLTAASHCRWCVDPDYSGLAPRCNDNESLAAAGCSLDMIQRPEDSVFEVLENNKLQDMQPDSPNAAQQIQPQKVRLSLKPRETKTVEFSYRPAKNYPLDLYYLMDLTWSMKDDKETLVSLQDDLPLMLQHLTDNYRLGFGSFADKPVLPFISIDAKRLVNPCAVEEETCDSTYSYKHHLSLTNNVTEFLRKVNDSRVTANLDNAEAQLDALVQVITCGNKIGWSSNSRKIVILTSDGLIHTAGDGKIGGAIKKNDEKCHLDENGYYSESTIYDYPSISQVYRLLEKHKVNVIFAVTESVKDHYDNLHHLLKEFTYVVRLESDSSNILKIVKEGYEDIVSVVDFEDDSESGPVKVKYFTDCGEKGASYVETTRCSNSEFGKTLRYKVQLTLPTCPEFKQMNQTIRILENQLGHDALTVEVMLQCGCTCVGDSLKDFSVKCPVNSHLTCGVCQCNKGWSGPACDCSIEDELASTKLIMQCHEPNVTHSIACSGAGDCVCGKCHCDNGFTGKYCQCRDCDIKNDCGGVERGVCVCGQCVCSEGWSGNSCDCPLSQNDCIAPGENQVCSGRGECICGKCQCSSAQNGTEYYGAFCEACATCVNPMCSEAESCVLDYLSDNYTADGDCIKGNLNYTVTKLQSDNTVTATTEKSTCILRRLENGSECEYMYTYSAGTKAMVAIDVVLVSRECHAPTAATMVINGLVIAGCIVAAGLIIVTIYKYSQMLADRRAYEKFVKEAEHSKLNMEEINPLYISPISEFRLPDSFPRDKND